MKTIKYSLFILCALLITATNSFGQTRKNISQFSHFQSYFNPALTGYEGSTVRGFVRNQWAGFEGAPQTFFFSTEIDFGEIAGESDPALMGKNAISINLLHDTYGAFRDNELIINYASRVRLTENHNLRLGAGINYQTVRLDGNAMTTEEQNDPTLGQYFGSFSNMQFLDANIGIALTHRQYYMSYALHRINGGKVSSGDNFMDGYPAEQIIQAGFREVINPNLSIITNAFFRSRRDLPNVLELNIKALLMDKVWVGAGHRIDYASNLQVGFLTQRMKIGYLYEFPMGRSYLLPGSTHEFTVVLNLFKDNVKNKFAKDEVLIW
ncbi:PorP/SprF family type IX secretion system membrane protein [Algoriphagus persicinus]|uniref:PorP/SprF family type IX secretion system membrane protein n=1 Tax=Algoriphagus persicinus TaxID=3108754 RepID=UPI002B3A8E0C|nr:type IX secretion system membrane protein PorP/SprF [Algoriphagus sp. E1-3-M2]MEB2786753.1 type IX secretion system membrane protein PorP/SprF [Algoriphagus sp. E1-3-M2]